MLEESYEKFRLFEIFRDGKRIEELIDMWKTIDLGTEYHPICNIQITIVFTIVARRGNVVKLDYRNRNTKQ